MGYAVSKLGKLKKTPFIAIKFIYKIYLRPKNILLVYNGMDLGQVK